VSERFALLIGAPLDDLRGVEGDLDRVEEVLPAYGFSCRRLLGPAATRAGIIRALRELESRTSPGDAVVVYYSGHGAQIENPRASSSRGALREPSHYRCLVSADIDESTAEDFRGVLSIELDLLVSAIADRSANVTVILDCCHSGGIVRDDPGDTLALHRPLAPGVRGHTMGAPWLKPVEVLLESLRRGGVDPHDLVPEADPRVLRLAACGPHEQAFETSDPRGHAGLMTTSLTTLLRAQAGRPTTWLSLATKLRQRVRALRSQHPTLKGPCDRLLFSLDEAPSRRTMSIVSDLDRPVLGAGAMAGVELGDQLLLMPMTEGEAPTGEAQVTHVNASSATFTLDTRGRGRENVAKAPLSWVTALPRHYARPRGEIELSTSPEVELLIRRALPSSGIVAVAAAGKNRKTIATIVEHRGTLHIKSAAEGPLLRSPIALRSFDEDHLPRLLRYISETVELLALRRSLIHLAPSPAQTLDSGLAEWSVATNHRGCPPLPPPGDAEPPPLRLGAQRRVFITLRNARRLARPIYGWILWCCPSGQIKLLSRSNPWGSSVSSDACYVLGERSGAEDRGLDLRWSSLLPEESRRRGDLILIAADGYADLRPWDRDAKPFLARDLLSPQTTRSYSRTAPDAPLQKHAHRFAVWRIPVERG